MEKPSFISHAWVTTTCWTSAEHLATPECLTGNELCTMAKERGNSSAERSTERQPKRSSVKVNYQHLQNKSRHHATPKIIQTTATLQFYFIYLFICNPLANSRQNSTKWYLLTISTDTQLTFWPSDKKGQTSSGCLARPLHGLFRSRWLASISCQTRCHCSLRQEEIKSCFVSLHGPARKLLVALLCPDHNRGWEIKLRKPWQVRLSP